MGSGQRISMGLALVLMVGAFNATRAGGAGVPDELDFQRRGLLPRRIELSPYFGNFVGDKLHNSLHVGGRLELRLTEALGVGAEVGWSPIAYDSGSAFGRTATGDDLISVQGVLLLPMPSALVIGHNAVVADIFGAVGGGLLRVGGDNRGDGFLGGGMKLYFGRLSWLAVRVEIRSYFSSLPTADGAKFTSDFAVFIGPTVLLPPVLRPDGGGRSSGRR